MFSKKRRGQYQPVAGRWTGSLLKYLLRVRSFCAERPGRALRPASQGLSDMLPQLEIWGEFPLIPSAKSLLTQVFTFLRTPGLVFSACMCSVVSNSLPLHGLEPARLLYLWDSPGKNTGVRSHSLLHGIFQPRDWTQASCIAWRFFTVWLTKEALGILKNDQTLWAFNVLLNWFGSKRK